MDLIFEKGAPGRGVDLFGPLDVDVYELPESLRRQTKPRLPEVSEVEVDRHYTALEKRTYGINDGIYLLGSCTMKHNPSVNEITSSYPGFANIHPLQEEDTIQGALESLVVLEDRLTKVTGMDKMTFQPAAGSHGEFLGLLMIRAHHKKNGQSHRNKVLIPDAAHGTNPASATMAGYQVVSVPSNEKGEILVDELQKIVGDDTAGLMLTNPNTEGLFDPNILEITRIVHEAGGLCYYDGANLNPIMGWVKPGDMGFDVIHLNLHKTFSTPHGGGGPGACAVGVKEILAPYLPDGHPVLVDGKYEMQTPTHSIGRIRSFWGNYLVLIRALTYTLNLGGDGLREAAENATLNANYMKARLKDKYKMSNDLLCMHEFVMSLQPLKEETGVTAKDVAKGLLDYGMHPPTMYFPLTVPEALMVEPTETETKESLDRAIDAFLEMWDVAHENPEVLKTAPHNAPIKRPDEVQAARSPILTYQFD